MANHTETTFMAKCLPLIDSNRVTDWQNRFLKILRARAKSAGRRLTLSEAAEAALEEIHDRHFGRWG